MALPRITIVGNLTADPELRYTQSGKPVVNLRVAANDRRKNDQGEWVDGSSTFLDVTVWRNAEAVARKLNRGSKVLILGELKQREYETKTGEKRTAYEVAADEVAELLFDRNGEISGTASVTQPAGNPWTADVQATDDDSTPF